MKRTPPNRRSPNNISGIIGVSKCKMHRSLTTGVTTWCWQAFYHEDGIPRIRKFSIARYGELRAFQMACAARYNNSGVLIVLDLDALPFKPAVKYEVV